MSSRDEKLRGILKMTRQWIDTMGAISMPEMGAHARAAAHLCLDDVQAILEEPEEAPQEAPEREDWCDLEDRLSKLEDAKGQDHLRLQALEEADLESRLDKLEHSQGDLLGCVGQLENQVNNHIDSLAHELDGIKARLEEMEDRLGKTISILGKP